MELDGEYIRRAEPVLGYIHRMHEKMGEVKTYVQYLPNMGRVDYLHALAWNWAYVGAVEKLMGIRVPPRAEYIRVITCELNRINSHLLWWGAYLLDLGAFTPIVYAFADRERIMDILQMVTGSRLTYCYFRFGGVSADLSDEFIRRTRDFVADFRKRLPMYRGLVTDNMILRGRCEEIGVLSPEMARRYGATGPVLRGSGIAYDVRRAEPYSVYDRLDFEVPTGQKRRCHGPLRGAHGGDEPNACASSNRRWRPCRRARTSAPTCPSASSRRKAKSTLPWRGPGARSACTC